MVKFKYSTLCFIVIASLFANSSVVATPEKDKSCKLDDATLSGEKLGRLGSEVEVLKARRLKITNDGSYTFYDSFSLMELVVCKNQVVSIKGTELGIGNLILDARKCSISDINRALSGARGSYYKNSRYIVFTEQSELIFFCHKNAMGLNYFELNRR